jgi:exonuclease III
MQSIVRLASFNVNGLKRAAKEYGSVEKVLDHLQAGVLPVRGRA